MHDADEIADLYGLGGRATLSGPLARGHQGEIWQLTTDSGAWAVKRSFRPIAEGEVELAAKCQEAAHAAGIATPELRRSRTGSVITTVPFGTMRVNRWVELGEADACVDAGVVGELVAAVHSVLLDVDHDEVGEPDAWYHQAVGAESWRRIVAGAHTAGAPFAGALESMLDDLVALDALVERPSTLQICHRDMWADNIRADSRDRLWVIDWDDCGLADPSRELAALLFEYAYDDPTRAATMYRNYVDAGGPGRVVRRADFSMAISQLGHILEIGCRRWMSPTATAHDRAVNEERVDEFIRKPFNLAIIDGLLAAITPSTASTPTPLRR